MEDLVQIKLPPKGKKCVVKDCEMTTSQVVFFGDLCPECYAFIAGHAGGEFSQAFRNAMGFAAIVLRERSTQIMASNILANYYRGNLIYWRNPHAKSRPGHPSDEEAYPDVRAQFRKGFGLRRGRPPGSGRNEEDEDGGGEAE